MEMLGMESVLFDLIVIGSILFFLVLGFLFGLSD